MSGDTEEKADCSIEKSDRIVNWFMRPCFLSLTIGMPFCMFKLLFGITAVRIATGENWPLLVSGWIIIGWAGVDLAMNLARCGLDITGRSAPVEYCIIAQAGRIFKMPYVFLALDTFFSFVIICFMLWSGWITELTKWEAYVWYAATTLNLISLSVVSLYTEIRRI